MRPKTPESLNKEVRQLMAWVEIITLENKKVITQDEMQNLYQMIHSQDIGDIYLAEEIIKQLKWQNKSGNMNLNKPGM